MNRISHLLLLAGLVFAPASFAFAQATSTGLELSSNEPIQIESDRFEVDDSQSLGVFTGNVSVVQGQTTMKAARMKVHYNKEDGGSVATGSSQIDRLEVDGGVYLSSEGQVATGDAGTFDMATEVLVLTGKEVVLSEGENVIVGCKLTVHMGTGQATLESCKDGQSTNRVRMLLTPDSQNR